MSDLGDKEGAIEDYNQAIRLYPDFANSYYHRGDAYQYLGEKQKALSDFREAVKFYQQQGKTSASAYAQNRIKKLGG